MPRQRLTEDDIFNLAEDWPAKALELAMELRAFVLETAPEVDETIAFNSLCYFKPDQPYGVIGGNVCLIGARDGHVHFGFIHGAALPDPQGLLQGKGKAARHIELRSVKDIRPAAFRKLIRAAVAYEPTA